MIGELDELFIKSIYKINKFKIFDVNEIIEAITKEKTIKHLLYTNSSFPEFRLRLISNGFVSDFQKVLETIYFKSLSLNENEITNLTQILLLNIYWHTGNLYKISNLKAIGNSFEETDYSELYKIYLAFIYNTIGCFEDSLALLNQIKIKSEEQRKKNELFLGVNMDVAVITWKIWNRNELMDYERMDYELSFIENSINNRKMSPKSQSLLLLSIAVLFLNQEKFYLAKNYLKIALENSIKCGGIWLPRIISALSICEYHLGNFNKSRKLLNQSINEIKNHFGPLGWQLRIAQSYFLHKHQQKALNLLFQVKESSKIKGEIVYNIWSKILIFEYSGGHIDNLDIRKIFAHAKKIKMQRACNYILKQKLI